MMMIGDDYDSGSTDNDDYGDASLNWFKTFQITE